MYQIFKDFAGPVATIAAAIGAVSVTGYFARLQWKTAEDRLRLDLFEKRLKVYLATTSLLNKITMHGSTIPDDLQEFYRRIEGAEFLFDDDLSNYYMRIGELCWQAQQARISQDKAKIDEHRNKLIDQEESIVNFLMEQHEAVRYKFKKYLDLSRIGH
jgi:hypothetical protein